MARVGHWLAPPERDPLEEKCWLHKHRGKTWYQVVDEDLPYIEWLIFDADIHIAKRVMDALLEAVSDSIPGIEQVPDRDWDHFD